MEDKFNPEAEQPIHAPPDSPSSNIEPITDVAVIKDEQDSSVEPEIVSKPRIPSPVFKKVLLLCGCGALMMIVGLALGISMGDLPLIGLSAIIGMCFIAKGVLLWWRIIGNGLFIYRGICISRKPKFYGRYIVNTFYSTEGGIDGNEWKIVMPKSLVFKIGHDYNCYFEKDIIKQQGSDYWEDMPTDGYLACEDLGIYNDNTKLKDDLKDASQAGETKSGNDASVKEST